MRKTNYSLLFFICFILSFSTSTFSQSESGLEILLKKDKELYSEKIFGDPDFVRLNRIIQGGDPDCSFLNELGFLMIKYIRYDEAADVFNSSIRKNPVNAETFTGLGIISLRKSRYQNLRRERIYSLNVIDLKEHAVSLMKKALEVDPGSLRARFGIAEAYLNLGGEINNVKAYNEFSRVYRVNPDFEDIHYGLGLASFRLGDHREAAAELMTQIKKEPEHAGALLLLGQAYGRLGETVKAGEYYTKGLSVLNDYSTMEDVYKYMTPLFSDTETREFFSRPLSERGLFLADYWSSRDPDVFTKKNERLIEHIRRINYVSDNFSWPNERGHDDRGQIYIKYGEPTDRHVDMEFGPYHHPTESWIYRSIDRNLAYDFVRKWEGYVSARDLSEASYMTSQAYKHSLSVRLYEERAYLGGIYNQIALNAINYGREMDRDRHHFGDRPNLRAFSTYNARLYDLQAAISEARTNAPAEYFTFESDKERFEFPLSLAQFRDEDSSTRLALLYAVPYSEERIYDLEERSFSDIVSHVVVLDTVGTQLEEVKRNSTYELVDAAHPLHQFSLGRESLSLKPNKYKIAIRLEPEGTDKEGLYQFFLPVRDFSGDEISASDILVLWESDVRVQEEKLNRPLHKLKPYPFLDVQREKPLNIYYELYNLSKNFDGNTFYRLEYSIGQKEVTEKGTVSRFFTKLADTVLFRKKTEIKISQERIGSSPEAYENIVFDISGLPEGEAVINVIVTDLLNGENTSIARPIRIIN